jgi:hypothetical protein
MQLSNIYLFMTLRAVQRERDAVVHGDTVLANTDPQGDNNKHQHNKLNNNATNPAKTMRLLQLVQLAIAAVICTVATANAAPLRRQSHRHYTLDEYARAHAHLPRAHVKRVLADHAAFKRGRASPEQARHRAGSVHHVDGGVLVLGYCT